MSCHRYHLDHKPTEEEFWALADEIMGVRRDTPSSLGKSPLDDVLASGSHVRILRVLSRIGEDVNLTGRDLAGRAGVSRARCQEVLRELVTTGLVRQYREATWSIYEINKNSPLAAVVHSLFEQERQLTSP